jgi:uncharacterized membrane protein
MYNMMHFIHVLLAFAMVSGAGAAHVASLSLGKSRSTRVIAHLAGLRLFMARAVVMPAAVLTIIFGVGLVHTAGYKMSQAWILISLVASILLMLVAMIWVAPRARRIRDRATELHQSGTEESDELRKDAGVLTSYAWADYVLTAVIIYLMIFRPGAAG